MIVVAVAVALVRRRRPGDRGRPAPGRSGDR
jgi:hypothetical protein